MPRVAALPLLLFFGFALAGPGCGAQAPQKVAVEEKRAAEPSPPPLPAPPAATATDESLTEVTANYTFGQAMIIEPIDADSYSLSAFEIDSYGCPYFSHL